VRVFLSRDVIYPALLIVTTLVLVAAAGACSSDAASSSQGDGSARGKAGTHGNAAAVPVSTAVAVEKPMPVTERAIGTAEAISTVQIRAQITGQLSEIHFTEGDDVRAGQPLFTLDPRPFEVALQQAQAVLAKDAAQANNAKAQASRYEDLFKRGLIPRDQYESQAASATSLQAAIGADAAAIEIAKLNLQYTRINAPVAGRTGSLMVHRGDLIRANDTAPMVMINQVAPIYVTFAVPGRLLRELGRYQAEGPLSVEAHVPDSDAHATGKMTFVDNAVDTTTGTIKLKGTFPNTDRSLWPGLFVEVTLRLTTEPHAVVVPSVAVQSSQQGQYVYLVRQDQTVAMQSVTVARAEGDESVIATGLKNGDTVVTDGQLRLTPGARITRRPPVSGARSGQ
jgi:membrane fusion protein, multidrug efflux system